MLLERKSINNFLGPVLFLVVAAFCAGFLFIPQDAAAGSLYSPRNVSYQVNKRTSPSGGGYWNSQGSKGASAYNGARLSTADAKRLNPISRRSGRRNVNQYENRRIAYVKAQYKYQQDLYKWQVKEAARINKARARSKKKVKKLRIARKSSTSSKAPGQKIVPGKRFSLSMFSRDKSKSSEKDGSESTEKAKDGKKRSFFAKTIEALFAWI